MFVKQINSASGPGRTVKEETVPIPVSASAPEVYTDEDKTSPKTSDSSDIIFVVSLLGAACIAFITAKKKKYHLYK